MNAKIEVSPVVAEALARTGKDADELLRRALGTAIPEAPTAWSKMGVTLPNGTELRAWHGGRAWWAKITGGKIEFKGEAFDAPSAAAAAIAGRPMNGWEFWEAHVPGVAGWQQLAAMRPKQGATPELGGGVKRKSVTNSQPLRQHRQRTASNSLAH